MKKYLLTSQIKYDLNLYADPEFAAIFWRDVENDSLEQSPEERNEEIETIKINPGDSYEIEWMGFEYHNSEIVYKIALFQDFIDKQINSFSIKYIGWLPKSVIDLTSCKVKGITITKIDTTNNNNTTQAGQELT